MNMIIRMLVLSLFVVLLLNTNLFGKRLENSAVQLEKYMEAYQNYLKAKVQNDPSTEAKWRIYNQAYQDYLKSLKCDEVRRDAEKKVQIATYPILDSQLQEKCASANTTIGTTTTENLLPASQPGYPEDYINFLSSAAEVIGTQQEEMTNNTSPEFDNPSIASESP